MIASEEEARAFVAGLGDEPAMERLEWLIRALIEENDRQNLVAKTSLGTLWRRHIADSAQLLAHVPRETGPWLDLGTGAGFPGLVLALMGGGRVTLVESNSRKCAFLREVIRTTGAPARVETARIEDLAPLGADVVTARACAPLPRLIGYVARHLAPGGVALLPKGSGAAAELTQAGKIWMMSASLMPSQSDPSGHVLKLAAIRPR